MFVSSEERRHDRLMRIKTLVRIWLNGSCQSVEKIPNYGVAIYGYIYVYKLDGLDLKKAFSIQID